MTDFAGPGAPLDQAALESAADITGADIASLWSLLAVETSGAGFLPDRRPKVLFERHYFSRLTQGRYDQDDPDISAPTAGGYGPGGAHQHDRLHAALLLDRTAALRSASWGLGQIMGDNYAAADFDDVEAMVAAFVASETAQLLGMARFLAASGIAKALRAQNWTQVARSYNGPGYAANHYDAKLANAYQRYSDGALPDIRVRQAQVYLSYAGYRIAVDGQFGPATSAALSQYQTANGLPQTGQADDATLARLSQ